jgi:hypothetical protein
MRLLKGMNCKFALSKGKKPFFCLCFLIIMLLTSCFQVPYVPNRYKKNFTYCFQDKNTGIDSLININGYFEIGQTPGGTFGYGSHIFRIDTFHTVFMFYRDGIFLYNFSDIYNMGIPKYFEQVVENSEKRKKDLFYKSYDWGCYKISGDTIKTQYINHPSVLSPTWMYQKNGLK